MSDPPSRYRVSIVVPCFNEEDVVDVLVERLRALADANAGHDFEFVFVNDGSRDATLDLLKHEAAGDDRIRIVSFARNFGHQIAVTAGIDAASGDCVVLIDADLQDPPELIPDMIAKWQDGYDVVYGTRLVREGETAFKRMTARAFYRLLNRLSDVPIPLDTGDFRLMGREVVDVLKQMPERHRFVRGMVAWVGFRQIALPYRRTERLAGTSKYPLRKMLRFALDGIFSFSSRPLQMAMNIGLLASALAVLGIFYAIIMRIFTSTWVEGWTALMIAVLFMGGVQLISLGVIGEYIGRIYDEAKLRPLYVVKERVGFPGRASDAAGQPSRLLRREA